MQAASRNLNVGNNLAHCSSNISFSSRRDHLYRVFLIRNGEAFPLEMNADATHAARPLPVAFDSNTNRQTRAKQLPEARQRLKTARAVEKAGWRCATYIHTYIPSTICTRLDLDRFRWWMSHAALQPVTRFATRKRGAGAWVRQTSKNTHRQRASEPHFGVASRFSRSLERSLHSTSTKILFQKFHVAAETIFSAHLWRLETSICLLVELRPQELLPCIENEKCMRIFRMWGMSPIS